MRAILSLSFGGKGEKIGRSPKLFCMTPFPFFLSPRPHPNTVVETSFKVNVGNMPPPSLPPRLLPRAFLERRGREKG